MVIINQEDINMVIGIWKWAQLLVNGILMFAWSKDSLANFVIKFTLFLVFLGNLAFVFLK